MNRAGMQHRDLKVKDYKAVRAENGDLYLEGILRYLIALISCGKTVSNT